jgi:hypothetical protein
LNANLYDPWSTELLQHLEASGTQGAHTAETIRSRGINIVTVDNNATNIWWKVRLGLKGLQIRNTLYLSRFLANKESNYAWVLMSFVHETRQLEEGFCRAFSVYGERELQPSRFCLCYNDSMALKNDLKADRARWKRVDRFIQKERRIASIELRWKQLNSAYRMAKSLGRVQPDPTKMDVYQIWAGLKEKAAGQRRKT